MALPKLDVPVFNLELPLSKKKIRFRPFLVKEEKLLLMAMESDDEKGVIDTIKQILNNCCLDDIDVNSLPITDIEFFFLNLRARSVNEIVELQYKCNNVVKNEESGEEKSCGHVVALEINVLEITPEIDPKHSTKVELSDNLGIVMKYPNFSMIDDGSEKSEVERVMEVIEKCIDYIYDKDNIYYRKDLSAEEIVEFIENLTQSQFGKIQNFFENIPKLKKEVNFKCGKCGYQENITLQGIQSFFV
jgi:hypothetical protein